MNFLMMPQELEVWYVLPALRRALANILVNTHNLSQIEVARKLGITKSAVSQYLSAKRAKEISFTRDIKTEIAKSAKKIVERDATPAKELYHLCGVIRKKGYLCGVHRKMTRTEKSCTICLNR